MTEEREEFLLLLNTWLDSVYSQVFFVLKKDMAAWEATVTVFRRFFSGEILLLSEEDRQKRLQRIIEAVTQDYLTLSEYIREVPSAEQEKAKAPHGLAKEVRERVIKKYKPSGKTSFMHTQRFKISMTWIAAVLICLLVLSFIMYIEKKQEEQQWMETELRYGLNADSFDETDFEKVRSEMEKEWESAESVYIEDGDIILTIPPEY